MTDPFEDPMGKLRRRVAKQPPCSMDAKPQAITCNRVVGNRGKLDATGTLSKLSPIQFLQRLLFLCVLNNRKEIEL